MKVCVGVGVYTEWMGIDKLYKPASWELPRRASISKSEENILTAGILEKPGSKWRELLSDQIILHEVEEEEKAG